MPIVPRYNRAVATSRRGRRRVEVDGAVYDEEHARLRDHAGFDARPMTRDVRLDHADVLRALAVTLDELIDEPAGRDRGTRATEPGRLLLRAHAAALGAR